MKTRKESVEKEIENTKNTNYIENNCETYNLKIKEKQKKEHLSIDIEVIELLFRLYEDNHLHLSSLKFKTGPLKIYTNRTIIEQLERNKIPCTEEKLQSILNDRYCVLKKELVFIDNDSEIVEYISSFGYNVEKLLYPNQTVEAWLIKY